MKGDPNGKVHCPVDDCDYEHDCKVVRARQGHITTRRAMRVEIYKHFATKHPWLTLRERSLLADRAVAV